MSALRELRNKTILSPNLLLAELYKDIKSKRNLQLALKWYEKAAQQGYAPAQFKLAQMYEDKGTESDFKLALKWYEKAAKQGYKQAQNMLEEHLYSLETKDIPYGTQVSKKGYLYESINTLYYKDEDTEPTPEPGLNWLEELIETSSSY